MKKCITFLIIILLGCSLLYSQELTRLIDIPTAGILQKGEASFTISVCKNCGVSFGAGVGIISKLMFGIEYGGEYVLGDSVPDGNPSPGVYVKYRIFDESPKMFAVAIGYDSRGYGAFTDSLYDGTKVNRYEIKSKGLYAAASKNFNFLGNLGLHGGINYSITEKDDDKDLNFFFGIDKSINSQISLFAEYDFAWNDDKTDGFGANKGYLNAALYLKLAENLIMKINFRDLLNNQYKQPDRAITIQYTTNL